MSKSRPSPKIFVIGEARICRIRGVYVAVGDPPTGTGQSGAWLRSTMQKRLPSGSASTMKSGSSG